MWDFSLLFPGWVGTGDGTVVPVQKPSDATETMYYNGKHKIHCMLMWTVVDKSGRVRWLECLPGSRSERDFFTSSGLYRTPYLYFLNGQYVIWDSALQGDGPVEVPYTPTQLGRLSLEGARKAKVYNTQLRQIRIRVEWNFARMFALFPVFASRWEMARDRVGDAWRACSLLLNFVYRCTGGIVHDELWLREKLNVEQYSEKTDRIKYLTARIKDAYGI